MRITSCYPARFFPNAGKAREYIKTFQLMIIRHTEDSFAEVFVTEDGSRNKCDLVIVKNDIGCSPNTLRLDVDDLEEALCKFRRKGYEIIMRPEEEKNYRVAIMKDAGDNTIALFQQK